MAVIKHDTILRYCFQDLAHALKDHLLEFGGHGAKKSLSHECDNAVDVGSVIRTVIVPFVLKEISDSQSFVVDVVITIRAIFLVIESSENGVIRRLFSLVEGIVLPVIPSVSDSCVGFENMVTSASYTLETRRRILVFRNVPREGPTI